MMWTMKVTWKFVALVCGDQYVTENGARRTQKSPVDNLVSLPVTSAHFFQLNVR